MEHDKVDLVRQALAELGDVSAEELASFIEQRHGLRIDPRGTSPSCGRRCADGSCWSVAGITGKAVWKSVSLRMDPRVLRWHDVR